jgi:hypothetical protein
LDIDAIVSKLCYLQDAQIPALRILSSKQVLSEPGTDQRGLSATATFCAVVVGPTPEIVTENRFRGTRYSQMDKRDPVVMQAIANVVGAEEKNEGCLCPPPGKTQAIYDEIRRLDRARLEAERRLRFKRRDKIAISIGSS